jgi:hypothetical protein
MAFDAALTAWATLALAVLALAAAILATLAWRAQKTELTMLRQDHEREAQERREAQVNRVYIWDKFENIDVSPEGTGDRHGSVKSVELRNSGEQPIYDITFVWYVNGQLAAQHQWALPLFPKEDPFSDWWEVPAGRAATEINVAAFMRDSNGNGWRISPNGRHEPAEAKDWPPPNANANGNGNG